MSSTRVAPRRPTSSLDTARRDLEEAGYCLLEGALPAASTQAIRARLIEIAEAEVRDGVDFSYSGACNQRVWSLLNKDPFFVELAEHPTALALVRMVLGEEVLLSNLSANIAGPGGEPMVPHNDQLYAPRPWPHALAATVIWCLDDFTEENGATLVAPGSHLDPEADEHVELVAAECPSGTAFFFDARLWHGTGANRSSGRRHGLLAYYCRPFVRQQENFFVSLRPEVHRNATPILRRLLGWESYEYIGMIDGPRRDEPRY